MGGGDAGSANIVVRITASGVLQSCWIISLTQLTRHCQVEI